jgi:hypothetical protein
MCANFYLPSILALHLSSFVWSKEAKPLGLPSGIKHLYQFDRLVASELSTGFAGTSNNRRY